MRLILNQSIDESIPLKEELGALKLYLELEKMRTDNAFDFEIIDECNLMDCVILVPSMLLQPFVENAIWHGIMNREDGEERKVNINLTHLD